MAVGASVQDWRPEAAEAIGVFMLVFAGCGAIIVDAQGGDLGPIGIAVVFTAVIAVLVWSLGHVSGAHFNPAITVAFAVIGHFPWRRVPTYLGAQALGAILGAIAARTLLGDAANLGATGLAVGVLPWKGIALEAVGTFLLAFTIASVATDARVPRGAAGPAIGLAVGIASLVIGPLTGASLNPSRSLGPALVAGHWDNFAVYLVGPAVGAVAAMLVYAALRRGTPPMAREDVEVA